MHIKKRGSNALLYRSVWVRKGAEGNSHGFARQLYVGSMSLLATEIPSDTGAKLTPAERDFVERRVVHPARHAVARARADAQKRALDPQWRLDESLRLLREAAQLSTQIAVPAAGVRELQDTLAAVRVIGAPARPADRDPLQHVVDALRSAARAISSGFYGPAPDEGVRKSHVYARWLEISEQVDGSAADGLLRELQARSWVKTKSR